MAVKKTNAPVKMTPTQLRKENEELKEKLEKFASYAFCYLCDTHKSKDKFYLSTDPLAKSGVTPVCKQCLRNIALRVDKNGFEHEPTMESVKLALSYCNKPFINTVWDASIQESENLVSGKVKTNVWFAYIKNIAMVQYVGMTYKDSDLFKEKVVYDDEKIPEVPETAESVVLAHQGQDTYDAFIKNKSDVVRLLDYDPFEKEAVADQPFLYAQILGILDQNGEANEDMLRTSAAISIARNFLQANKIDDTLVELMADVEKLKSNSAVIKTLQESKSKIMSNIKDLAAENCLSLKNSKTVVKGSETWTGKLKKIRDLNLRDGRFNGFDLQTCKGMRQVQEISDASIMKQLALDESEWSDMVSEMRVVNQSLRNDLAQYKEINRILLQENLDLKDYLEDNGIQVGKNTKDLKDLYAVFSAEEEIIDESNAPAA